MLFRVCYTLYLILLPLIAQTSILDSNDLNSKKPKKIIEAILGDDIKAPGLSAIILDASRSRPNNGSLTFEWSFPENLIFENDYEYDNSQTVVTYSPEELIEAPFEDKTSIKTLITRNQYIELDLPNYNIPRTFLVVLKVQNHVGMKDFDTLSINLIPPVKTNFEEISQGDEYVSIQDSSGSVGVELTETIIDESLLSIQPINKSYLKPREVQLINSLLYNEIKNKGFENVLNPNRFISKEIKLNRLYERYKIVQDTIITESKAELPTKISLIQKIENFFLPKDSNDSLNVESVKDTLKGLTIKKSNPELDVSHEENNVSMSDSSKINFSTEIGTNNVENTSSSGFLKKFFQKFSKAQESGKLSGDTTQLAFQDSLITKNNEVVDIDLKNSPDKLNEIVEGDSSLISIATYDTTIIVDTLKYDIVVDTTLFYNFMCRSDSCAVENAILEGAGKVLTWGLNDNFELEMRYFSLLDFFDNDWQFDWTISDVLINPDSKGKVIYPMTLATGAKGNLYVGEANSNNILEITKDQKAKIVVEGEIAKNELSYPSGLEIGSNQEIYFSDQYNNRILINAGDSFRALIDNKSKYDVEDNPNPMNPTSLRIGPDGAVYVLFDKDGSVYKIAKRQISTVLNPNKIQGIDDFAINSKGEIFILSTENKKVYKIINEDEIATIAGLNPPKGKKTFYSTRKNISSSRRLAKKQYEPAIMDNFPAVKIPFGHPVSIDIDLNDNLYVADDKFGTIRKIDNDGIITTFYGPTNDLIGVSQLRISNGENFEIFISKPFSHELKRISYNEISPWIYKSVIEHPLYIIEEKGVYGLEEKLNESLAISLQSVLPTVKKTLPERISYQNKKVTKFISKNPLFCGLLLLFINQGVTAALEEPPKLPPDFPF